MNNNITKISQSDFEVEPLIPAYRHDLNVPGSLPDRWFAPQIEYGDKNGDETVAGQVVSVEDRFECISTGDISPMAIRVADLHPTLQINLHQDSNDPMVKIQPDGSIEYGKHYSPDEAAKTFWAAMSSWAPKDDRLEKVIKKMEDLIKVQCSHGNYNYDEYMYGMANGMILALAVMKDEDPNYLDRPEEWLKDRHNTWHLPPTAQSHVGTQPQCDDTDYNHPSMVGYDLSDDPNEDPNEEAYRIASDMIRDEIDQEILNELFEIVEEENKDNFERSMKGV